MTVTTLPQKTGVPGNSPIILSQSGVPVGIPSSGSIGNNGALSGLTAFPTTYAGIYLYFPANAIFAGSAAGLYYCVMSSTTAGTIYNNTYPSGDPEIPTSPTAFTTTGPGAYTQSTAEITLRSVTAPGGLMGRRGSARVLALFGCNNSANTKTCRVNFGGSNVYFKNETTNTLAQPLVLIRNRGMVASQVSTGSGTGAIGLGSYATTPTLTAVNTAVDQSMTITGQLASASDFMVADATDFEVLPS